MASVLYCGLSGGEFHEVVGQDKVGWWCVWGCGACETETEAAPDWQERLAARGQMERLL